LLQAQVILGMVNPQVVQQLLQGGSPPVVTQPSIIPNNVPIQPSMGGIQNPYPRGSNMPSGPITNQPYLQPYQPAPESVKFNLPSIVPQPAGVPISLEQQKLLLQQVLSLTPAQIDSLPLAHQQQVRDLQRQLQMQLQGMGPPM